MTGRHAAPRERSAAPRRAAVVAGVATMTMPLSLPTAQAAPSVDWDRVAQCESTQRWDANTGNGYSGGLQFLPSTWRAYGGTEYAPAAYQASRSEQIAIAENVLRGQGIGAWPTCGKRGLGGVTRNPGTPSSSPAASSAPDSPAPAIPDQPRPVREAIAASGPTNPACRALKERNVPVGQLDRLNRAHPELYLDGNGNGVPCEVTYPRASSSSSTAASDPAPARSSSGTSGTATSSSASSLGARVVADARNWVGVNYRWGGNTRSGVDCSGLVQQVFRANGISLPRTARTQMAATIRISRAQARPGDLVGNPSGTHIGIVVGPGMMIDAPHAGKKVGVRAIYSDMTVYGRVR